MKLLVTGGLGFIGSNFIVKLLENTKQLAEMYSEIIGIKKAGWENVLRAREKRAEKEKRNG